MMPRNAIHWLRTLGKAEAVSFLALLGVAMPLKYAADLPEAVAVVGWVHGVLFLLFCAALLWAAPRLPRRWAVLAFLAALLPGGPFVVDPKLRYFEAPPENHTRHRHV